MNMKLTLEFDCETLWMMDCRSWMLGLPGWKTRDCGYVCADLDLNRGSSGFLGSFSIWE